MAQRTSIWSYGFATVPIRSISSTDVDAWAKHLLSGANRWFHSKLAQASKYDGVRDTKEARVKRDKALKKANGSDAAAEKARETYRRQIMRIRSKGEMAREARTLLKKFDLRKIQTLSHVFDAGWRKTHLSKVGSKVVRYALDGNSNAQCTWMGWRKNGFGIWSHIRGLDFVARVVPLAMRAFRRAIQEGSWRLDYFPTIIFKPPVKGDNLAPHIDGVSYAEAFEKCLQCKTTAEWVQNVGVQNLLHLKGANVHGVGHTTILGPMNPTRYRRILAAVHPKHRHPELPALKGFYSKDFPAFYGDKTSWYHPKILAVLNRLLHIFERDVPVRDRSDLDWIQSLKRKRVYSSLLYQPHEEKQPAKLPIRPMRIIPSKHGTESPYLALWPTGFIHGANSMLPNHIRISVALPVVKTTTTPTNYTRSLKRIQNLLSGNYWEVLQDSKTPYATGNAHSQPKIELKLYPLFKTLYVTKETLQRLMNGKPPEAERRPMRPSPPPSRPASRRIVIDLTGPVKRGKTGKRELPLPSSSSTRVRSSSASYSSSQKSRKRVAAKTSSSSSGTKKTKNGKERRSHEHKPSESKENTLQKLEKHISYIHAKIENQHPKLSKKRLRELYKRAAAQSGIGDKQPVLNSHARSVLAALQRRKTEVTDETPLSIVLPSRREPSVESFPVLRNNIAAGISNEVLYGKGSNSQIRDRAFS